ncbi:MAG: fumarylacetoacetate hydrolase [Rhizobiales bacterium 62-17]|nr:fumarylacetoacetate hydrolase family protein [Hyphomicrobiales bacterium]OJY02793.1 MAG: fumarylacetoacetate hydrolase [Rhizobiales bacterium 62-17]
MKILFFNDWRLGILKGTDTVVDVGAYVTGLTASGPHDLINQVIARFDEFRPQFEKALSQDAGFPLSSVKLLPPLPRPINIDCMAVNYMEDGTRAEPAAINAFHKSPFAIIGPGGTMVLPDIPATVFEGEAEIALVIGKRATNVPASEAMSYVFGYVNFIDGSARGVQPANQSFYQMKSRDTFAPIGPWIVTADEIADPQNLQVKLWNNGALKQNYNTSDMAHKIPRCIEFVSSIHTLESGDILALGTNHRGLHAFQDNDKVEMEVEGLGRLAIVVKDDLKRTWPRETRLQRQDNGLDPMAPQLSGKHAKVL